MGGHGSLVLGLRNPDKYRSISAFSAICNPVNAPWGKKAFGGYLGDDQSAWKQYDATELAQVGLLYWTSCSLVCALSLGRALASDSTLTSACMLQSYSGPEKDILLDIGTGDNFLKEQLLPEALKKAADGNKLLHLDLRMQVSYIRGDREHLFSTLHMMILTALCFAA